ncbi:MAG: UDP-3-O-acyl-N-acetylglucosamine deacetylase [Aquificaceae bacterium]|nr:UDP-3-O-acyl-N-acetylglucosamine deacetylase [Aquificaceae bacterium]MDW8237029.1 UDP-3-O-acyl-N-acetylglucosamine deacetylase [Aquificaceae bacterium]
MLQASISKKLKIEGFGLHTGGYSSLILHPEGPDTGIWFVYRGKSIRAHFLNVVDTTRATSLGSDGVLIRTVEHLLASLYILGIDNLTIELIGNNELPILDGSGFHYFRLLRGNIRHFNKPKELASIQKPIKVELDKASITAIPCEKPVFSYAGFIKGLFDLREVYFKGFAPQVIYARTFCYLEEVNNLLSQGFGKGASDKSVLVLHNGKPVNAKMRYIDEPLRHKLLDLIGDFALFGARATFCIRSLMGNHRLNIELLKSLSLFATFSKSSFVSTP